MKATVVARSVSSRSGVMNSGRIPQSVDMNARRFYGSALHGKRNVIPKNDFVASEFLMKRVDYAIFTRSMNVPHSPQNKLHRAMSSSTSSDKKVEENPFMRRTGNANEDDLPPITIDNTIRMKNAALALFLLASCAGIMLYSMNAVGQAGASTKEGDPLAALKAEAAVAQEKYDKEQQDTANTADMLEKFQKGEYDPDHVSDEELDDLIDPKRKRPWWKVW